MIKKIFILEKDSILFSQAMGLGAFIFGVILMTAIARIDAEEVFQLGTLMAVLIGGLVSVGFGIFSYIQGFNQAVSMGRTRRSFVLSYMVFGAVQQILICVAIFLYYQIETAMLHVLYPDLAIDNSFAQALDVRWAVLFVAAAAMAYSFFGALLLKYGKKAFWVIWAFWMAGCILPGRIVEAVKEESPSVLGVVGRWIGGTAGSLTITQWLCVGIVLCIVLGIWGFRTILKQEVAI